MAKERIQREDANSKLSKAIASDSFQLHGFGTHQFVKAEEDKTSEKKPKTLKPPKTELEKWAREWKEGDPIPIIPVGHKLVLDVFPGGNKGKLFQPITERNRSINEIGLIESKAVLGQTLNGMPGVSKLIAMVAKRRGIPVDDQGKLRCPAGTPAANQFTDLQMSNCLVPSARTVASNAVQTAAGAASRALSGSMAARTHVPDGDRDDVTVQTQAPIGSSNATSTVQRTIKLYGAAEAARRFLSFKIRHAYQKKIVSQYFGNVRDVQNARKALLKAYPNMDEASIKKFLEDYGDLTGKDLLDYIDSREEFITSLLYESLKNPEAAKAQIAWIWSDQIGETGNAGFAIDVTAEKSQPFVKFSYNPRLWIENKKDYDENPDKYRDWLGMGYGNNPDEIHSAREYGAYVGGHEFGHLADFHARFKRAGLNVDDTSDTDLTNVWAEVKAKENVLGKTVDQLKDDGDITLEQKAVYDAYETFIQEHQNAQTPADVDKATKNLYDKIHDMLATSSGLPPNLNDIIRDLVGSGYANADPDDNIETHAEAYKVFSSIPEIIQQRIDKLNSQRAANDQIPPVNKLSEMMFGVDITGIQPPDTGQAPKPGVIRRISRAARAAKDPNAPDDEDTSLDKITTNVVDDFVQNTQENLQRAAELRKDRIRKSTLDRLFMHYSPEEIDAVITAIPQSQQGNNQYIASLLKVPEVIKKLRTPNGQMHSEEQKWRQLAALAINNDWLDFTAITDAHTLRGGKGPLRTILANTREQRRLINVTRTQRAARRQASATARKLSGSMSAGTERSVQKNTEIIEEVQNSTDFYNPQRLTTDLTDVVQRQVTPESVAVMRQSINNMPVLSEEKRSQLKAMVEKNGVSKVRSDMVALGAIFDPDRVRQELSAHDGIMLHNPYYGPGLPLAIERELALASGDTEKVKKIDAFINYLNTATESEMIDDLTKAANDFGDSFDRRISVFIKEPQKFIDSGIYYTQFDIDARREAGIFSATGGGGDVRGVRRNAESMYGIPPELEDRLRPASGVIQQSGLGKNRRKNLRSIYGEEVEITEDYTIGREVDGSSNVGRMYGRSKRGDSAGGQIILKPHVAERARFTAADSLSSFGAGGVEMASSESLRYGASAIGFAKGDPLTGLLYHSLVDDGLSLLSPAGGSGTSGYNEALIPGSFSMDDVQAIVVNAGHFGRENRAIGARVGNNDSMIVGIMSSDTTLDAVAFSNFVIARQELLEKHGTTLVLDSVRAGGVDSVELFNPQMTRTFVKDVMPSSFPNIKDEDINPDSTVADMILLNHLRDLQDGKTSNMSFSKQIEEELIKAEQDKNVDKFKEVLEQGRLEAIQAVTEAINSQRRETTTPNTGRTRGLSGSMSTGQSIKTGKVSRNPEDVVRSKPYSPIDKLEIETLGEPIEGLKSVDTFPVYTVGSEKLAFGSVQFGNQVIELDADVKILPLNPYIISNSSSDSDEGRNIAMTWWDATIGAMLEDKDNSGYASALLYSSSRGDKDAEKELQRLAAVGKAHRTSKKDKYVAKIEESMGDIDWISKGDENTLFYGINENYEYTPTVIDTRDLFAVHQTSYKPTIDENGNLILRPTEDFGDNRKDDGTGPMRYHRGSIHFSLNHLVQGHMDRQSPTGESYAIITGINSILENNPDSLDNLFGVDTVMTPKPGEGLVMPRGTYRIVRLPSAADMGIEKWMPESGNIARLTDEERIRDMNEAIQFQAAQKQVIDEMLDEMGKETYGPDYKPKKFPGGMHGTSYAVDSRIEYLASLLGVKSTAHHNLPIWKYEQLSYLDEPLMRNISRIENTWDMSINAMLRLMNSDRLTTAKSEKQQVEQRRPNSNFLPTPSP